MMDSCNTEGDTTSNAQDAVPADDAMFQHDVAVLVADLPHGEAPVEADAGVRCDACGQPLMEGGRTVTLEIGPSHNHLFVYHVTCRERIAARVVRQREATGRERA